MYLPHMCPHPPQKGFDVVHRTWVRELTVIKPEADPQVIHQQRKADHHCCYTHRSSKFIPVRSVKFTLTSRELSTCLSCWSSSWSIFLPWSVVMTLFSILRRWRRPGGPSELKSPLDVAAISDLKRQPAAVFGSSWQATYDANVRCQVTIFAKNCLP